VVSVFASVRDQKGQIIRDLSQDDFLLEEQGRPQTIRYFSRESNLPLTVGLLVDTSLSQRRVLGQERSASYRFLDQVLSQEKDRAFILHFDREVELLQDLTSSRKKLEDALAELELPQEPRRRRGGARGGGGYPPGLGRWALGGTELYDSIMLASDELMKKQTGRKALILLTDGVDNGSRIGLARAIETAQRADTLVYSILFSDRDEFPAAGRRGPRRSGPRFESVDGKKVLERISRETGGGFFEVSSDLPIQRIYDQLEEELRNQYSLGYTPDMTEPGYRTILVTIKRHGSVVQARAGYFFQGVK
jgi:VWFA-related protein